LSETTRVLSFFFLLTRKKLFIWLFSVTFSFCALLYDYLLATEDVDAFGTWTGSEALTINVH